MFGFRRRENPQLQLYGKLPLAKDYLRLGLGEGAGLALRDWLDATFSGAGARDNAPRLAWPARFLIGDAWRTCLQGVIVQSSDAGGHRSFPFALCVERRRRAVLDDLQAELVEAGAVWAELRERRERCAAADDGRSMLASQRGAHLEVGRAEARPSPRSIDVEDWLEALWPGGGRSGFEADLEQLCRVASSEPLRLPLAAGCSQRRQVLAWLETLERIGLVPPRSCPTIFFPESRGAGDAADVDPSPGYLVVFRSAPGPSLGAWLSAPSSDSSLGPADLVGARPDPSPILVTTSESLPPLAASLRTTVAGLVRRLRLDLN